MSFSEERSERQRAESPRKATHRGGPGTNGPVALPEWTAQVAAALDLPPSLVDRDLLLDLARDAAHGVARPAAPLTTYLAGIAVGRGAEPAAVVATIRALLVDTSDEPGPPDDPATDDRATDDRATGKRGTGELTEGAL